LERVNTAQAAGTAWARLARPVLGLFRLGLPASRSSDDHHHGANLSRTRTVRISIVKPCASRIASVAPFGAAVSKRNTSRWSVAHRHGTPVSVSRPGCPCQFGRASAPTMRQAVRTRRYVFLLMGRCVRTTPEFLNQPARPILRLVIGGWSWSRSSFQSQLPSASASFLAWSGRTAALWGAPVAACSQARRRRTS
jgi:hypothetical protein